MNMTCNRCGCGIYDAEDQITLNKIWHKCCFCCRNCNVKLDKCSAKIYQGEIYCECCYDQIIEDLNIFCSPPCRPCRVVSSPSCICIKEEKQNGIHNKIASFDYSKKYDICFRPDHNKVKRTKTIQSCSCLIETKKAEKPLCFSFPIPREVANYYNRANMRRAANLYTNCCPKEDPCASRETEPRPCIRVRTISPSKKCFPSTRCRSPSPEKQRCCCSRCRQPSCPPPCPCACPNNKPCYVCRPCPPKPRSFSPSKRSCPTRRKPCVSRCPGDNSSKQEKEWLSEKHRYSCDSRNRDKTSQKQCTCCCEKMPKYCICGRTNPCNCNMSQIRAVCTSICVRCGHKVYAAEKISVSGGAYHTSCFSCCCCHRLLDVKNVYENCGEIYCKSCYNNFFGISYYGYGSSQYH